MSLEAAILENTNTMKELIAVWNKLSSQGKTIAKGVEDGTVTATTAGSITIPLARAEENPLPILDTVEAKKPAAASPPPETAAALPASKPEASKSEAAAEPITYAQVSKAITDGVKTNRDHVVATLAQFGAKKGTELAVEQYADFLAAL